ncbi:MAG TPA: I78 family peptidase inhibitor [Arenimonas sp.]|uniref:I78 family peptidase inhibitor n=1 Tax=Arenimonas sp. TaxID=1872635 RepID=UPI002BC967E5|nr:I78 family peptidase inhibitor [Arenimonas sp.]HMB56520.1 I78 family peptidase inhibitor [Arenimonas sp.]
MKNQAKRLIGIGVVVIAASILTACASSPPIATEPPPATKPMTCEQSRAAWAIGKFAEPSLLAKVREISGARVVRVIKPGQMVTMEFNAERVDVRVDGKNIVLGITCG